jgi:hypothetical protein
MGLPIIRVMPAAYSIWRGCWILARPRRSCRPRGRRQVAQQPGRCVPDQRQRSESFVLISSTSTSEPVKTVDLRARRRICTAIHILATRVGKVAQARCFRGANGAVLVFIRRRGAFFAAKTLQVTIHIERCCGFAGGEALACSLCPLFSKAVKRAVFSPISGTGEKLWTHRQYLSLESQWPFAR